ncbi:hypothetical protein ANCDUO_16892, partial [Ancylostoma duodenale]
SVPVNAEYFDNYVLFMMWLNYMPILYLFSQIFKIASVFCLIMASIERYKQSPLNTSHQSPIACGNPAPDIFVTSDELR